MSSCEFEDLNLTDGLLLVCCALLPMLLPEFRHLTLIKYRTCTTYTITCVLLLSPVALRGPRGGLRDAPAAITNEGKNVFTKKNVKK